MSFRASEARHGIQYLNNLWIPAFAGMTLMLVSTKSLHQVKMQPPKSPAPYARRKSGIEAAK